MSRLISAFILLILIISFSSFAVVNRDIVRVNFNFLLSADSFYSFEAPLFLVILAAGLIGMGLGMILPLLDQLRKKQKAWQAKLWKQEKEGKKDETA